MTLNLPPDIKEMLLDLHRMRLELERSITQESQQSVLVSRKGSVRGRNLHVYNTIRRLSDKVCLSRDYEAAEDGKIVVYITSCSIIRKVWERCRDTVTVLQGLHLRCEVRDLNLNQSLVYELLDRLHLDESHRDLVFASLPMVYVNGQYFGNDQTIFEENETKRLSLLLKEFKGRKNCEKCGGAGYVVCTKCGGGKKSVSDRFSLRLRCAACDQNGIARCDACPSHAHIRVPPIQPDMPQGHFAPPTYRLQSITETTPTSDWNNPSSLSSEFDAQSETMSFESSDSQVGSQDGDNRISDRGSGISHVSRNGSINSQHVQSTVAATRPPTHHLRVQSISMTVPDHESRPTPPQRAESALQERPRVYDNVRNRAGSALDVRFYQRQQEHVESRPMSVLHHKPSRPGKPPVPSRPSNLPRSNEIYRIQSVRSTLSAYSPHLASQTIRHKEYVVDQRTGLETALHARYFPESPRRQRHQATNYNKGTNYNNSSRRDYYDRETIDAEYYSRPDELNNNNQYERDDGFYSYEDVDLDNDEIIEGRNQALLNEKILIGRPRLLSNKHRSRNRSPPPRTHYN